jgi:nitrogen fixation NifU-like protein
MSLPTPQLESLYQELILDHYKRPHHAGLRDPFDAEVHHVNPTCGDEVTLRVKVVDGVVQDVSYTAEGCSISQASTSVLAEQVVGASVEDALAMEAEFLRVMQGKGKVELDQSVEDLIGDGIALAGVAKFPARIKCALLGWMAFKDSVVQTQGERA